MCLAGREELPLEDGYAEIDYGGVFKQASLRLMKNVKVGDYVLVHAGFVIQLLDQDATELDKFIAR